MSRIADTTQRVGLSVVLGALLLPFGSGIALGASPPPSNDVQAVCPTPAPGTAQCQALVRTDTTGQPAIGVSPATPPSGFGPADIQSAYALASGSQGAGLTVAVVDAFDLPTAESDLATYRTAWGLPPCTTANGCFRKVNQFGGASPPSPNTGWGEEIALDIDMVSATCPNCNILLVEASSNSYADLGTSVNLAVSMGAVAVSNSYTGPETSGLASAYEHFFNHPGVAITASTGDCGYNCAGNTFGSVGFPAVSPFVIAVGGTTLTKNGSARGWAESAWGHGTGGAGSGCSLYSAKPAWQTDAQCSMRTQADVSAVADPQTGVSVYDSFGASGWVVEGGTSASSPIIASIYALAGGPAPGTYPGSYLYGNATHLNDVISGNNNISGQSCPVAYLCNGTAGFDGPTGLGTPSGTTAFTAPTAGQAGRYHPLTPVRLLDTRVGNGFGGQLLANTPSTFPVTSALRGDSPVPATATAVTGNLTVTGSSSSWAVYLGPNPTSNPTSSTINFSAGEVTSNGLTVALGSGGTLSATYISTPGNTTDLVFDVTGYFTPEVSGATFHAMTPARLLDTRARNGLGGKLLANTPATFQVAGRDVVPVGATAVTGNVTVVNSSFAWAVYVGPDAIASPTTSTINFNAGQVKANSLTVALSATGSLSVTYMSTPGNTTDLVFDVTGYYTADSSGASYVPVSPARLVDTRVQNGLSGKLLAGTPASFSVAGRGGVSPAAIAVTGNVTVAVPTNSWAVYVGPAPVPAPTTSTLNFNPGEVKANGLTVALGSGWLSVTYMSTAGNTTDLVFDVTGYFVP